jgi:hypothetical protein
MSRPLAARVLALALALAAPAAARADLCDRPLLAPPELGLRDTGFDRARGACLATTARAAARALALIDEPRFYGTLSSSLLVAVRGRHAAHWEWELAARVFDYRFAQNAVVTGDELAFGPLAAGLRHGRVTALGDRPLALAAGVRLELPRTDSGYGVATTAAALSAEAGLALSPRLALHGRAAALAWAVAPGHRLDGRAAFALSADTVAAATGWLAGAIGLDTQLGWYGLGLDHLLVRAGARLRLGGAGRLDLAVAVPLLGRERADLVFGLGFERDL